MTLLARTAWFLVGVGLLIGAMLLTVHLARAQDRTLEAVNAEAMKRYHCRDVDHCPPSVTPIEVSPQRKQINACISAGIWYGRGVKTTDMKDPRTKQQLEQQDDWLYFCMQQARWAFCDKCEVDPSHNWDRHQSCSEAGGAAYYDDECWEWLHNLFHSPKLELRPKSQDRVPQ